MPATLETAFEAVRSTLLWASLSTVLVIIPGGLVAYCLARFDFQGKQIISTLFSLPLVLPPTAVGYLLLRIFAQRGPLGKDTLGIDLDVLLTWKAVLIACALMSLPLVVRTARVSFENVNPRYELMAGTLGYGPMRRFFGITLPLSKRGLLAAIILGFTRAMGEFGATVVIAGNIPGRTQTLSSAIFSAQQSGNEQQANFLLVVALAVGFFTVYITESLSKPQPAVYQSTKR
ncbi:MAG: molybdate ABC transporter permease subunit [Acidobacteriota bacterium]|nr:molybdate ABC transporter permease subunit [Acidobacteriota bacterium]